MYKIISLCFRRLARSIYYRWRLFCSFLIKNQMREARGKVYIGRSCILVGLSDVSCLGNFTAQDRNRIEAITRHGPSEFQPSIVFGNNVSMEYDCHIGAVNRVEIHDNVLLASRVYISDHGHGLSTYADIEISPNMRAVQSKGPVIIEQNVWIGEGVAVMPGVTIGRNSIIGANSVVTKDIPAYSVAAGCPARVIKHVGPRGPLR